MSKSIDNAFKIILVFYFELIITNNNTLVCIFIKINIKLITIYLWWQWSVMTISIDQIFNSKTGANAHIIYIFLILIFNQKYLIKDIGLQLKIQTN